MDRYVKNFIGASIFYLAVASIMGVLMLVKPGTSALLRFPHSHLMLIGWVTMMIYGVGYHILPRFAGRLIKNPWLGELQFWVSNIGLIGMTVLQPVYSNFPANTAMPALLGISGGLQVLSSVIFFYNMGTTLFQKDEEPHDS